VITKSSPVKSCFGGPSNVEKDEGNPFKEESDLKAYLYQK